MTKKTYTVKKQKDGDYEVTLHNVTKTFSLKELTMSAFDAKKHLDQISSQRRLNRAVGQNISDHHKDVITMFKKLPKVKQTALINHIQLISTFQQDDVKYRDAKKRYDRIQSDLAAIHAVIPSDEKKLTKSEQRRINAMKK